MTTSNDKTYPVPEIRPEHRPAPAHRMNLRKLLAGLRKLPPRYSNLVMQTYARNVLDAAAGTPEHPCGTPACIIGHGPSFGVPMSERQDERLQDIILSDSVGSFLAMGRVFSDYSHDKFCPRGPIWAFLFGSGWPDDVGEAIKRLELILDWPDDVLDQINWWRREL